MGNTRTNDDGFRGEYPKPLDWVKIQQELLEQSQRGAEEPDEAGECDTLDP